MTSLLHLKSYLLQGNPDALDPQAFKGTGQVRFALTSHNSIFL